MTGANKGKAKRTVSFFRLMNETAAGQFERLGTVDWQKLLETVQGLSLKERTYVGPTRQLIGHVMDIEGGDRALKLMEPRDENSWLEILRKSEDEDAGGAGADAVDPSVIGDIVETTIVVFLPRGNLVGMILGSTSSPTHTALAEWLDNLVIEGKRLIPEGKGAVRAEPALSASQRKRLDASDGVSMASVRISTDKAAQLREAGAEDLAATVDNLQQTYGNIFVTITLRVPRGRKNDQVRKELKKEAQRLQRVAADAEAVSATLVTYDAESRARSDEINFISQRITTAKWVPLTGDDGQPIRNASAVRAILQAADELRDELDS